MKRPEILFAYRKIHYEGQWHVKCVNCGAFAEETWDWPQTWQMYLPSGRTVLVTLPPRRRETSSIPRGPDIVYGTSPIVRQMDPECRVHALVAQNEVVIVTGDDLDSVSLPQFLSKEMCSTEYVEIEMKFNSPILADLPDVCAYERRMNLSTGGDGDLKLFLGRGSRKVRIPAGVFLPATINSEGVETPVVYSVKEWQSDSIAVVECYMSKAIAIEKNTKLERNTASFSNVLLGSVAKKVE